MKELTFKDVWKPPFHTDLCYIYSSNNVMALMTDKSTDLVNICNLLNGKEGTKYPGFEIDGCKLHGPITIIVRGWGYLTGCGGLHLSPDIAAKIQDDSIGWIKKTITTNDLG